MKHLTSLFIITLLLCTAGKAFCADDTIYINSDTLDVDYGIGIAEYKTNVFVQKKESFDLHCDRAKIFFITKKQNSKKNAQASGRNIKHIELHDNITIVKDSKTAKGDFGVIYPDKKLITLTGKVALRDKTDKKENYLEGSEVQYHINEGIFKIKSDNSPGNKGTGRVKIILSEEKKKND
jgi:lipopolysaccharide transport protein LptA